MASFNKVILIGNLTRDPELRQTQSGTCVCRFSIAVNRSYNAQDGSARDEACFVEIDCFGKSAENIAKFFSKGKPILVEGRLRQESWQDKQTGQNRTKLMVVLERFEFVGGGFAAAPEESGGAGNRAQAPKVDQSNQSDFQARYLGNAAQDELEDDIPF